MLVTQPPAMRGRTTRLCRLSVAPSCTNWYGEAPIHTKHLMQSYRRFCFTVCIASSVILKLTDEHWSAIQRAIKPNLRQHCISVCRESPLNDGCHISLCVDRCSYSLVDEVSWTPASNTWEMHAYVCRSYFWKQNHVIDDSYQALSFCWYPPEHSLLCWTSLKLL